MSDSTSSSQRRISGIARQLQKSSKETKYEVDRLRGIDGDLPLVFDSEDSVLTNEDKQFYAENGYLLVKGVLNSDEVDRYTEHFKSICRGEVDAGNMLVMKDIVLAKSGGKIRDERDVTKVQDFQNDEVFMHYARHPKVLKYVESIIGKGVRSIHTMLINKPPDLGKGTSEHPMHQDLLYFPMRPANKIVAAWAALQHIDKTNGGLSVVPGSHVIGLKEHVRHPGNGAYVGVRDQLLQSEVNKITRLFLEMDAGDIIFFHPCLLHGSEPNLSDRFRKAISVHYAHQSCEFLGLPEESGHAMNELRELFSKKYKRGISREEWTRFHRILYKAKSRGISGKNEGQWRYVPETLLEKMIDSTQG